MRRKPKPFTPLEEAAINLVQRNPGLTPLQLVIAAREEGINVKPASLRAILSRLGKSGALHRERLPELTSGGWHAYYPQDWKRP